MEAVTHILTGVLIQILCFEYLPFPYNIILTIIIAFFSHFMIDALAKITYHTPEARLNDKFWVLWHIFIIALSVLVAIWFFIPYWLGLLSANLVDIWDWLILRNIQNFKSKSEDAKPEEKWGEKFFIHPLIDKFRAKLFFWLPNWNYKKRGVIPELILISALWTIIYSLNNSFF
jgi:hypothetical protein